jgi:glycine/D-amino acid oxidase-like deaminating enzyme
MQPLRHTRHGYWIGEAGMPAPQPSFGGRLRADVAIIGGGYTGMWTAWHIKQLAPGASIAIVESEVCGTGPSGRNGGFVNAMWFSLPALVRQFGDQAALAIADAADESVRRIGRFCEEQGVDAWYRHGGYMHTSTAVAQDAAWAKSVQTCRRLGRAGAVDELDGKAARQRCDSPLFRGGALYTTGATVQPARLAFGLRRRLIESGVRIIEGERAAGISRDRAGATVLTGATRISAGAVVLAIGSAAAGWPRLRHRLTVASSHVVATEPVPDVVDALGWTGGESITDSRALIHYFRTTPDGRIVFGWGGGRIAFGSNTRGRAEVDRRVAAQVSEHLVRFFPALHGRRIERAWGGPIDASPSHLPLVVSLAHGHAAFGYTGNGVGPSQLVGRVLASLALDRRDWASSLAFVDPPAAHVPPEPFRFIGGTAIRRAIVRKEALEEQGRRAGALTRFVAGIPERIGFHIGR